MLLQMQRLSSTTATVATTVNDETTSKKNFIFDQSTNTHIVIILILLLLVTVSGDSNWLQECDVCHCNWNSGKKTANCHNKSLIQIPTKLSSELQVIDLSFNVIPEIRRDEFYDANLQNLHKLFMKNCTLQEINRDALKGLSLLIELDLSNNLIRTLHAGTFSGLVKLRNLLMNNNEIEILENNLFRDLLFLHRIEFKHNHIKKIEPNAFINLPQLTIIYLDDNRLTILKKETFENMPRLKDLSLAQNPWNCTCELQPFREFTLNRKLYTPPTDCQEPKHLNGKLWSDIPTEDFACRPVILHPTYNNNRYLPNKFNTGTKGFGSRLEATSENVTITCHVKGSPKPEIYWLYNKRPINLNDHRIQIRGVVEQNRRDIYASDLTVYGIRTNDKGIYTCVAENRGGKDELDFQLAVSIERIEQGSNINETGSNLLLIICIAAGTLLLILTVVVFILCCYCRRRIRNYTKDSTLSENGLISTKIEKSKNGSILEGSVITEMQKSLLTEVNPVEKPPRRTDIETTDTDDGLEIKKTLLDETAFGSHDEETNSVTLSDTTPRSRQVFVENSYGTNLPPDLLAFPAHGVPHSPSLQSSMSNIPDNRLYGKSPLSSPVYQHITSVNSSGNYETTTAAIASNGFRTLQHPKSRNLLMVATNNRNNSPFVPAPIIYPPVVMKQGYMTIPRKPRVPSWTPSSLSTALAEYQPTPTTSNPPSVGSPISPEIDEPVYDNLGRRTTAGGNSVSSINKLGSNQPSIRYTMKDRPLPETPASLSVTPVELSSRKEANNSPSVVISNGCHGENSTTKIYEPIHELSNSTMTSDTEPLYGTAKSKQGVTIVPSKNFNNHNNNNNTNLNLSKTVHNNNNTGTITKIPPRPPPKPKKKISVISNGQGSSTTQLFEDECDDGTEV